MRRFPAVRGSRGCRIAIWLLTCVAGGVHAGEHLMNDFLLFPSLTWTHQQGYLQGEQTRALQPAVDFFYSGGYANLRVLTEFLLTRLADSHFATRSTSGISRVFESSHCLIQRPT